MPRFCRKPQVANFYSSLKQSYTKSTIMLIRSSERNFKIWNIRLSLFVSRMWYWTTLWRTCRSFFFLSLFFSFCLSFFHSFFHYSRSTSRPFFLSLFLSLLVSRTCCSPTPWRTSIPWPWTGGTTTRTGRTMCGGQSSWPVWPSRRGSAFWCRYISEYNLKIKQNLKKKEIFFNFFFKKTNIYFVFV